MPTAERAARAFVSRPICGRTRHVVRDGAAPAGRMVGVLASLLLTATCTPKPDPIRVENRWVLVENQTDRDWTDVEVWVNDHYRVTRESIRQGERFQSPLDAFVAGFGQRFDVSRQSVAGILVVARAGEQPVRIEWGTVRRR